MVTRKKRAVSAASSDRRGTKNSAERGAESKANSNVSAGRRSSKTVEAATVVPRRLPTASRITDTVEKIKGKRKMNVAPIVEVATPAIKMARSVTGPEAKETLDGFDRFIQALPQIAAIVGGFTQALQASRAQQEPPRGYSAPNAPVGRPRMPVAPPGWLEASPMMRWQQKYDQSGQVTAWYQQGEAYEAAMQGMPAPSFSVPQQPQRPMHYQPPQQYASPAAPVQYQEVPIHQAEAPMQPPQQTVSEVERAMVAQNETYLALAANHLENMQPTELDAAIRNPEELLVKVTPFKAFIPVTVAMYVRNNPEEFMQQMIARAPKTWAHVQQSGQESQARALIERLREALI